MWSGIDFTVLERDTCEKNVGQRLTWFRLFCSPEIKKSNGILTCRPVAIVAGTRINSKYWKLHVWHSFENEVTIFVICFDFFSLKRRLIDFTMILVRVYWKCYKDLNEISSVVFEISCQLIWKNTVLRKTRLKVRIYDYGYSYMAVTFQWLRISKNHFSLHMHTKPSFAHRLQTAKIASSRTSAQNNGPRARKMALGCKIIAFGWNVF